MVDSRKVKELFDRSVELAKQDNYEGAIKVLSDLIAYFPLPDAYRNRAMCYKDLIESGRNSPSEQQIRQWLLQAKDDLSKAIELYKDMPSDVYRQTHGDETVSFCYDERGEIKLMLATTYNGTMTELKEINPDNEQEFMKFLKKVTGEDGNYGEDVGLLREAVSDANESIKHNQGNVWAYRLKGFIYDTHFNDPKTAIEQYSKVISINASPLDYFNRAWCNYQIGNRQDACSDCKRAVSLDPDIRQVTPTSANRGKREQWLEFRRECM